MNNSRLRSLINKPLTSEQALQEFEVMARLLLPHMSDIDQLKAYGVVKDVVCIGHDSVVE
jgi:hypothetical protein